MSVKAVGLDGVVGAEKRIDMKIPPENKIAIEKTENRKVCIILGYYSTRFKFPRRTLAREIPLLNSVEIPLLNSLEIHLLRSVLER